MDNYIILQDNEIITNMDAYTNQLPFLLEEANQIIKNQNLEKAKCINISEDIRIQRISVEENVCFGDKQQMVYTWRNAFFNNNINGFKMPRRVDNNEEYIKQLRSIFKSYEEAINTIAFKYEYNLVDDVKQICQDILETLNLYLSGDKDNAKKIIAAIINKYKSDEFWVSELDQSYAFRGVAPFLNLHSHGREPKYDVMMSGALDFYRARSGNIKKDIKQALHIPYNRLKLVTEQRFSLENQPCLYLGTTSYVCWKECREPDLDKFFISGFRANEEGKKLKIFNLAVSECLVNGICRRQENNAIRQTLQNSMIKLLPIVFATSFVIDDMSLDRVKYEYIISHLVMQSLSELNIDGVAYLSKRGKDDFQYPQGVNLAIPVFDINFNKQYGDVCGKFLITEPEMFNSIVNEVTNAKSYIHQKFNDYFSTVNYKTNFQKYLICDDNITAKEYKSYQ